MANETEDDGDFIDFDRIPDSFLMSEELLVCVEGERHYFEPFTNYCRCGALLLTGMPARDGAAFTIVPNPQIYTTKAPIEWPIRPRCPDCHHGAHMRGSCVSGDTRGCSCMTGPTMADLTRRT